MDLSTLVAMIPGPWGIFAGVGLTIAAQFVRARLAAPAAPTTPPASASAPASPAPAVTPVAPVSNTPVLDGLFAFLKAKFGAAPASAPQDLTHETAADLLGNLFGIGSPPPK